MGLTCLLNWISIKAFRADSYFRAPYSMLTSEYQIESGILRRAACKVVQMTLCLTPSICRFQTITARRSRSEPALLQGLPDLFTCEVHWDPERWAQNGGKELFLHDIFFPPWEAQINSPWKVAHHTVRQHTLCSLGLSRICQLPIRPH